MQQRFLSNLFLLVLLNLLVKPFYILGVDAEVQLRVGEEAYGNYFSLLNFSFLLNILLDLGISNYNARLIAQHPNQVKEHFGKIFQLRIGIFFLYAFATLALGVVVGYNAVEFYLLSWLILNQFLVAVIQFLRSNLGGLHLFRSDAVVSVMDRLLLILFCAVLLWSGWVGESFDIRWFVYAQTLAYTVTILVAFFLLRKHVFPFRFSFREKKAAKILKDASPYALLIFLMMMYNRLDSVLLERMLPNGDHHAGIYAQGYRYLDAVNMFALLFAGMLLPVFSRLLKEKGAIQHYLDLSVRLLMTTSIAVGLIAFFWSRELLEWRYGQVSEASATCFRFLILSFIPVSATYIFGTLLTANGSLKVLNQMAFFGLLFNVGLNLLIIPFYEVQGAAVVALATQLITAAIQVVLVYRLLPVKKNSGLLLALVFFAGFICAAFAVASWLHLGAFISILVMLVTAVISASLLRLIRFSDLREMLSFTKN